MDIGFKKQMLFDLLLDGVQLEGESVLKVRVGSSASEQLQTNEVFSEKWEKAANSDDKAIAWEYQKKWYLRLYGFESEEEFSAFLKTKKVIFDAGCGLGYKAAWFAELSPESLVIAMDYSEAVFNASETYSSFSNICFIQGDIAATVFKTGSIDYVSCDQVIMHTQDPDKTFAELSRVTSADGEFACYFYAKKALPRELVDDYFRHKCRDMSSEELWEMSEQLTELGKRLSELNVSFQSPAIPALGIKAGKYDIQRFVYWNFLKCFWNEGLGWENSLSCNFDWYSPSNARRFSKEEIIVLAESNHLTGVLFHSEEACYSGRWKKK